MLFVEELHDGAHGATNVGELQRGFVDLAQQQLVDLGAQLLEEHL